MKYDEWYAKYLKTNEEIGLVESDLIDDDIRRDAYKAGYEEACRRYNLGREPETYTTEYGHYGENNPPVGDSR